ncbi:hypothetical protein FRC03_004918, partial [Tulasnella sp. 419]
MYPLQQPYVHELTIQFREKLSSLGKPAIGISEGFQNIAKILIAGDDSELDPVVFDENPKSALDEEKGFWEEYVDHATKYDAELVKGLRDDLNSLLMFAGLFSAINTAFIIESIKDLKRDQAETTNELLRVLIRNLHDPSAYSSQDVNAPAKFKASRVAILVNSNFFASLSCALLTALGAVMAKQWLNHYENDGPPKPVPEKCRERQMKLVGFGKWRLEGIIEALPILLQLSLFLFFAGLTRWFWDVNLPVSLVILSFSCIALLFYLITTGISIWYPWSPFQSPISRYLRGALDGVQGVINRYIGRVYQGLRFHGYCGIISCPLVFMVATFRTDEYMRVTLPAQLVKDLFLSPGSEARSSFTAFLYFQWVRWRLYSLTCFLLGIALCDWILVVYSLGFATLLVAVRFLGRWYLASTYTTRTTPDPFGESCVLWLAQRQRNGTSSFNVSDHVIAAAFKLAPGVFEKRGVLTLFLSAILRPRRSKIEKNVEEWVLDTPDERLLMLLGPLGSVLSRSSATKLGPVIFGNDGGHNYDKEIWSQLCDRLWRMVVSRPRDEVLVGAVSSLLNTDHIIQWNINPPTFGILKLLQKHTSESIHALSNPALNTVSENTRSLELHHLTILSSAYTAYLESESTIEEPVILDEGLIHALIHTMEENDYQDGGFWNERLLHLWLQRNPAIVLPLLMPRAALFTKNLEGLQKRDALFWMLPNSGPIGVRRSDSLGHSTLRLLLIQDHSF